jgi:outer membrane protein
MMRSSFFSAVVLCAASMILPSLASAQSKVGIINMQKAVLETAEIKKASGEMQARFKPRQDQLEQLQKDLSEIQAKLQSPQTPPAQQAELQAQGTMKQRQAQRIQEDLQADVERDRTEILQRAGQRMTDVVKKMADEKGLDVVIDTTTAVFFRPALEVTQEAIAAYDRTYPVK